MTAPFKLRPYQVAAIEGARRAFVGDKAAGIDPARAVIVTMPTGCHARGQAIMLADYSCAAVEDIAVGDLLAGPDLQPRRVLELHRGRQVMVRIRPTDGAQPWEVNLDHVLTLAVRGQDPTKPAGWVDISVRDYLARAADEPELMLVRVHPAWRVHGGGFYVLPAGDQPRHPRSSVSGFTVEHLPEAEYFGFELDGDHRYLLGDGTATHNSGKSVVFKAIAEGVAGRGRRVLLLVEGVKLVHQAAKHLREAGLTVGIEMAEFTAVPEFDLSKPQRELLALLTADEPGYFVKGPAVLSASILCERGMARKVKAADMGAGGWYVRVHAEPPQVVVASVDSLVNRLDRYEPDAFRVIIYDEAHHLLSPTSLQIIEHFGISVPKNNPKDPADLVKSPWNGDALLMGLTATPDRGDKRDLMQVFQAVGYEYDIRTAIDDGWLVPIRQEFCHLEGLDLSKVRKTAGDLDARQLCELLEPLMVPICESIKQVSAGRPTLCYSPLCNLAESATQRLRLIEPDRQIHTITGETEGEQREEWFRGLDRGEVWALSSVGTLTEGVDLPRAAVAVMLRLTMSRLLYAQILGRVLRPAPEIAHALNDCATAEERRAMIAASSKPFATILDFAGNSKKHKLVRAIDILTDEDDPAKQMAEILMEKGETDPIAALEAARKELADMLEKARGKDIQRILVSPFDLLDVPKKADAWGRPATDRQINALLEAGVIDYRKSFPKLDPRDREEAAARSREEALAKLRKMFDMTSACQILSERSRRIEENMASPKQLRMLIKAGIPAGCARAMLFKTASAALDQLAAMQWKATPPWIERWSAARMEVAA